MDFIGSVGIYTLIGVLVVVCVILWGFVKHVK